MILNGGLGGGQIEIREGGGGSLLMGNGPPGSNMITKKNRMI